MALNAILTPFPADFEVWAVTFSERVSEGFELLIRGASTASHLDLPAMLGHRLTLSLPDEPLLSSVDGILTRAVRGTPEPSGVTVYDLHVAPAQWLLRKRTNSRIFQKKTTIEIAQQVLAEHAGWTKIASFVRELKPREYCVQYDETDHDFLHRLLAEDGIASYHDHSAGGRWTFVDDTALQKPPVADDFVVQTNAANLKPRALAVLSWTRESSVQEGSVVRRDFDFQRPRLIVEDVAYTKIGSLSAAEGPLEDYRFEPGRVLGTGDRGEAERDLEAARAPHELVRLRTTFAAGAGVALHVEGDELTGDWLVVESEMHLESIADAVGGRRSISMSVIPLASRFRPKQRKRPLVFGVQSARVVGDTPEGTVDVDEYGRVKLEMRWDRRNLWVNEAAGRGNPSLRVRVAQAWAGPGYGLVTLPRVGDEVLVAYEDGNPDRPIVIGRAHNATSATPLSLPDEHKTVAVWKSQSFGPDGAVEGYNFIQMDDAAGAETLAFRAQRDMSTLVLRDSSTAITGSETVKVTGGQSLGVGGGQSTQVGGIASLKALAILVTAESTYYLMGQFVSLNSGGDFAVDAVGERTDKSAVKHHFESPAIFLHGKNGVQVVTKKCHIHADEEIVLQCKGSSIHVTPGAIRITSPGPVEINGAPIKLNC